jgi:hypothetical protein
MKGRGYQKALTPGPSPASGRGERVRGFDDLPEKVAGLG